LEIGEGGKEMRGREGKEDKIRLKRIAPLFEFRPQLRSTGGARNKG